MFKHQVVGTRRERSFRSRDSRHIVGVCTLEAVDGQGRFHDFDRQADWWVERGEVTTKEPAAQGHAPLLARCRPWALEEVVRALAEKAPDGKPLHEFYTRHPTSNRKVKVFGRRWITTRGNGAREDNLHALPEAPDLIACDLLNRCRAIPRAAEPVFRGHGADC